MTSYFRAWLNSTAVPNNSLTVLEVSPPPSDDEDTEKEDNGDPDDDDDQDDSAPSFPSPFSAQRLASKPKVNGIPKILSLDDADLMPPPPAPSLAVRRPGTSSLAPPGATLGIPSTKVRPEQMSKKKGSRKVALAPGHGALDWANLKSSGEDLRGVDTLLRIPPSVLKKHNKKTDAWSAFNGKVYNMTPYLAYHPGGEKELMRVAGRDGTKLFADTHAWVNVDFMLDQCMVGFLVAEPVGDPDSD